LSKYFLSFIVLLGSICFCPLTVLSAQLRPGTLENQFEKRPEPRSRDTIILPSPSQQQPPETAGKYQFILNSLHIEGGTVYSEEELQKYYQEFLGQEITVKTLFAIAGAITNRYADDGYALSLAYVPAQEIDEAGDVRLVIVEGYIGEVSYQGDQQKLSDRVRRQIEQILQEKPLTIATLERQLLLANDMPGMSFVTTIDRSSLDVGAARLVVELKVQEFGYFAGVNNRGSRAQGPYRFDFGVNADNVLIADSTLALSGQCARHPDEMQFYAVDYGVILADNGFRLNLQASLSMSEPDVAILQTLEYETESENYRATFIFPWLRSRQQNLDISYRFDIKESESQFFSQTNSREKTRVMRLGVTYDWLGHKGATSLVQLVLSQGLDILGATDNDSSLKVRSDADYTFTAIRLDASREQWLTRQISLFLTTTLQYSSDPLAPSEQIGWGGEFAGHAYDSFELSGDHGAMAGVELRYTWQAPVYRLNYLQPYVYVEGARLWKERNALTGGGTDSVDGCDYGAGIRGLAQGKHYFYLEIAKPGNRDVDQEGDRDIRLFAGWEIRY
jgi:hemolysin activation/secretion protein